MGIDFSVEITSHMANQHMGLELSERYYLDPIYRLQEDLRVAKWARERYPDFDVYIESGEFSAEATPVIRVGGLQPYLIISALFGAEIHFWKDHEPSIGEEPLSKITNISGVRVPEHTGHPLIQRLLKQLQKVRHNNASQLPINPPFFWDDSGWAFVHAPFTTAYKLRGEKFFLELHTNPKAALHLIDVACEITCRLIDLFAAAGGRRITGIHLGDCSASLVSPKLYRQFAVPAIERMTSRYGPGRLHSCGNSTHLLSVFRDIQGIKEYHLGWNTDIDEARAFLGDVPIAYLIPPTFLFQDSAEIKEQMYNLFTANSDSPLTLWFAIDSGISEEKLNLAYSIWVEKERESATG